MASQYRHALINAVSNLLVTEYSFFAVFALLVYDWLIFLDEEIDWFWDFPKGRRLTAASLLYGLSRYPPIFSELFSVVTVFRMSEVACIAVNLIQIIASLLGDVAPAIFSSIRVYALLQNKVIGILTLLLLAIPPLGAVVLNAADEKMSIQPKPFYCTNSTSFPLQLAHNLSIAARICSIVGELLVLFITLYKTRTFYAGEQPRVLHCGPSLTRIMLHNGTTYFMAITVLNVLDLSLFQTPANVVGPVVSPMTSILTCRFLCALRRADRTGASPSSPSELPSLSINFATVSQSGHSTLPPFIASMGSQVSAGLQCVSPVADEGESGAPETAGEPEPRSSDDRGQALQQGDELESGAGSSHGGSGEA